MIVTFNEQFLPKIYDCTKIYTIRDRNRHGEFFIVNDICFIVQVVDSFLVCELKKRLYNEVYKPIQFGFDTRDEMDLYYWKWFNEKKFLEWDRLVLHQILYYGHENSK